MIAAVLAVLVATAAGSALYLSRQVGFAGTSSTSSTQSLTGPQTQLQSSTSVTTITRTSASQSGGNSLQPCPTGQTLFSVLPVSPNDTAVLTPLGQMSPPGHVFPAPHQYIYVLDFANSSERNMICDWLCSAISMQRSAGSPIFSHTS